MLVFGMGGASEVYVHFYLKHIAYHCSLGVYLPVILGFLVEPSLLSDCYSWALVSVSLSQTLCRNLKPSAILFSICQCTCTYRRRKLLQA